MRQLYDVLQEKIREWGISPESQAILDKYFPISKDTDLDEEFNSEDFADLPEPDDDDEVLRDDENLLEHQNSASNTPPSSQSKSDLSIVASDFEMSSKAAAACSAFVLTEPSEDSMGKPHNDCEHAKDITGHSNIYNSDLD